MRKFGGKERGFTLPELMIVIVLLGILAAIAIPNWFGLIEARRVESAANQLAADLRLAHSRASNQVGTPSSVTLYPERSAENAGSDYMLRNGATDQNKTLPDDVRITIPTSQTILIFSASGGVEGYNGEIRIRSGNTTERLTVNSATSNVEVLP